VDESATSMVMEHEGYEREDEQEDEQEKRLLPNDVVGNNNDNCGVVFDGSGVEREEVEEFMLPTLPPTPASSSSSSTTTKGQLLLQDPEEELSPSLPLLLQDINPEVIFNNVDNNNDVEKEKEKCFMDIELELLIDTQQRPQLQQQKMSTNQLREFIGMDVSFDDEDDSFFQDNNIFATSDNTHYNSNYSAGVVGRPTHIPTHTHHTPFTHSAASHTHTHHTPFTHSAASHTHTHHTPFTHSAVRRRGQNAIRQQRFRVRDKFRKKDRKKYLKSLKVRNSDLKSQAARLQQQLDQLIELKKKKE